MDGKICKRMRMLKLVVLACAFSLQEKLHAECPNVHCRFEYLGHHSVQSSSMEDFMKVSAVSAVCDKYFLRESMPFRKLNWHLDQLERAVCEENSSELSNSVFDVVRLLEGYKVFLYDSHSGLPRNFPIRLRMQLLEKIEYSMARLILGKWRNRMIEFLDALLPDHVINEGQKFPSWHCILTFKRMLFIACAVENYRDIEGCYPLKLDALKLSETRRKCACGRDIEYEYHDSSWVLRSRCDSYDGGLRFDEYIPMIYNQRKRLDLCLSPTFNEKRRLLFCGEGMNTSDIRLTGNVIHDKSQSGVHSVRFTHPSAGCGRIVPLSEQKRGVTSRSEEGKEE